MVVTNSEVFDDAPAVLPFPAPSAPEVERAEPVSTAPAWARAVGRVLAIGREAVAPEVRSRIGGLARDFVREVTSNARKVRAEDAVQTLVVAVASAVLAGMQYVSERIEAAAAEEKNDTTNDE